MWTYTKASYFLITWILSGHPGWMKKSVDVNWCEWMWIDRWMVTFSSFWQMKCMKYEEAAAAANVNSSSQTSTQEEK